MALSCPKCSKQLPEVETLEYRFCPHCGVEIPVEAKKLDEAYLTFPPDLASQKSQKTPNGLYPETGKKVTLIRQFNDQTIKSLPLTRQAQPKIKPPDTPPPDSFLRASSSQIAPSTKTKDIKKQPPAKTRNKVIIAILVFVAVAILILGGLYTF